MVGLVFNFQSNHSFIPLSLKEYKLIKKNSLMCLSHNLGVLNKDGPPEASSTRKTHSHQW